MNLFLIHGKKDLPIMKDANLTEAKEFDLVIIGLVS